jgi:hypothetical protein
MLYYIVLKLHKDKKKTKGLKASRGRFKTCVICSDERNPRIGDSITHRMLKSDYKSPSSGDKGHKTNFYS